MGSYKAVAALLAALAAAGCGGATKERHEPRPAGPRLTAAVARQLDAGFRAGVRDAGIPGASASIVFPDGRQWSAAAGKAVLHPARRMTTGTSFPFDSVTKVAAAALALRLVEEGRLRLDDPVRRWYPAWSGDRAATVRELLGHTSGARDTDRDLLAILRRPGVTSHDALATAPRPGPRSRDAEYSNVGFIILGEIERRAGGAPVAQLMRAHILGVPGGDGLAFQPAERPHLPLVHPYWYPHGLNDPVDAHDGSPYTPNAPWVRFASTAGALAGDVPSLARWGHALLTGRILRPASLRDMTRSHDFAYDFRYGLGLMLTHTQDQQPMWGHVGDGWGTHTEFWYLPRQRLTLAVSWNDDVLEEEGRIVETLLDAARGR